MSLPENIKSEWFSITSRIQSVARARNLGGYAIVSLKVLVDQDGNPKFWTEPEITKIEPKRLANIENIDSIANEFKENLIKELGS